MTAFGFCVVAALSSQINWRPWTRSCRMGKSCRIKRGSSGRLDNPKSGTTSGRNSTNPASPAEGAKGCPASVACVLPGIAGCETRGKCGVNPDDPGTAGIAPNSLSGGALVGADEGSIGTPGADCAPGTPWNENKLLTEGNDVGDENGAPCSGPAGGATGSVDAAGAGEAEGPGDGFGRAGDDAGKTPLALCVVGAPGDTNVGSGLPGTDTPGARGKEYISLAARIVGPTAKGSGPDPSSPEADDPVLGGDGIPGAAVVAAAGEGTAARSAPPGGPVGGDESPDGIPGKEYISVAGGIGGAAAQGPVFAPSKTSDDAPGKTGAKTAGCDARPADPASEVAIAR